MVTALIFPGQGALPKQEHIRELYSYFSTSRKVLDKADEIVPKIKDTILNGSQNKLKKISQQAVIIGNIMKQKAMEELSDGRIPGLILEANYVTGHSLGQIAAAYASKSLKLEDALKIVKVREDETRKASQQITGGMGAVIGLEYDVVSDVCRQSGTYIANVNTPTQIVIVGEKANLADAVDLARVRGAKKYVSLDVIGPFHSKYMAPAQEKFDEVIELTYFKNPEVPMISNINGNIIKKGQQIKKEISYGLQKPVEWVKTMNKLKTQNVKDYLCFNDVMKGLTKQNHKKEELDEINLTVVESSKQILEYCNK